VGREECWREKGGIGGGKWIEGKGERGWGGAEVGEGDSRGNG